MAGTTTPQAGARAGGSKPNLYEVIRDQLINEIESGRYPSGALLPSVRELTAKMAISTTTARKALTEVIAAGYARPEGTRGHVSAGPRAQRATEEAEETAESTEPSTLDVSGALIIRPRTTIASDGTAGSESEHTNLDVRAETASAEVATALALDEPTAPVLARRRLTTDEHGTPVELRTSYMRPEAVQGTALAAPEPLSGPWLSALADALDRALGRTRRYVSARHPTDSECAMLGLKPTACVLVRTETTSDEDGRPLDHTVTLWPAESTRLDLGDE